MEFISENLYLIIPIIMIIITMLYFVVFKKNVEEEIDFDLYSLIDRNQITSINLIRNKIVLEVKDIEEIDVESLKQSGAISISIVGDKIKFIVKDTETTIKVFNGLN